MVHRLMPEYKICLYTQCAGFTGPTEFMSENPQWEKISPQYRAAGRIEVPKFLFDEAHCVPDTPIWRVAADGSLVPCAGSECIEKGSILVPLESPHRHEYKTLPLQPVRHGPTRERLRRGLEVMIPELGRRFRCSVAGRQVVVANTIRYQMSLDALMISGTKIQPVLRDEVFHHVFEAGGREEFFERLSGYEPEFVLFAPTSGKLVGGAVRDAITGNALACPWAFTGHPFSWTRWARLRSCFFEQDLCYDARAGTVQPCRPF